MNHLQYGNITLKGSKAQALIKPCSRERTKRLPSGEWRELNTIRRLEEQTERTITERVKPMRKAWRPYLKNRWGLNYYHFGVVLHLYKCGTEIRGVQFIAGLLLDSERKSCEIHQRRAKFQQGRLAESEFKRQLAGNQWLYGLPYTNNEMRGVLQ